LRDYKIPEGAIRRLSIYLRYLEEMGRERMEGVSSDRLATKCMVNAPLVRKDLSYFGKFGVRGVGYSVKGLIHDIKQALGLSREWRMAVIGIGNLGSSLLVYKDFLKQNYKIVAAFDIDPPKVIGRVSGELGKPVEVLHIDQIKEVAKERKIEIGLITTPPSEAQNAANMLVEAGVRGILNFAPVQITVPEGYVVKDIFFTTILDNLTYLLSNI
jgi:redox-sensing transcriptional repressor